jgi:hypothetical protein
LRSHITTPVLRTDLLLSMGSSDNVLNIAHIWKSASALIIVGFRQFTTFRTED